MARTTFVTQTDDDEILARNRSIDGSNSETIRTALRLLDSQRTARAELAEYIDWLQETHGEPTADDRAWAKRVMTQVRSDS
jgi:hypothetical protein